MTWKMGQTASKGFLEKNCAVQRMIIQERQGNSERCVGPFGYHGETFQCDLLRGPSA